MLERIGNEPELYPSIQGRKLTYFGHTLRSEVHKNIGTTASKDAEEGQEEDELKTQKNGLD